MSNRLSVAAPVVAIALILSACQEADRPTGPTVRSIGPAFTEGDAGDDMLVEPASDPQSVDMPSGSDFICVGTFTGVFDDVLVPPNAICILIAAEVRGNIKALENSTLAVFDSRVRGNVHGDKADAVQLLGNEVGGNIDLVEGGRGPAPFFEVIVCNNTVPGGNVEVKKTFGSVAIGTIPTRPAITALCRGLGNRLDKGNIKSEDNIIVGGRPQGMDVRDNTVRQNIQVFKNAGPGPKFVQNNAAGESIQCFDNAPLFVGTPNSAPKQEGQCGGL